MRKEIASAGLCVSTCGLAGAASGLGQKAKDAAADAGQKVQSAAGDAKGAAAEYAGKAQSAAGDAKGVAAEYAGKAQSAASGAASGARDAAAAAGQRASGAAAGVAGAAAMPAGGVPLWAYAALGVAGGAVAYYSFKASPGSPGAPRPSCCCAPFRQGGCALVCTRVFGMLGPWACAAAGLRRTRRVRPPLSTPFAKPSMRVQRTGPLQLSVVGLPLPDAPVFGSPARRHPACTLSWRPL